MVAIKSKKILRIIIVSMIIIGLGSWTYASLIENKEEVEGRVYKRDFSKAVPVKTAEVAFSSLAEEERYLGTFEANRTITLASQTQGEVIKMLAEEGDELRQGALIAKIDDDQLRYQLMAAEASYEDAKRDAARYEHLTNNKAVAEVQLDKARMQLATSESQVNILKKQIENTSIRAPFSGILVERQFDLGSVLSPGMSLGTLTDISLLKLVIMVPEERLSQFRVGQSVTVKTEVHPSATYEGIITVVGSLGDDAHNFPVHVRVANPSAFPLKAGMYGYIQHSVVSDQDKLSIPVEALVGSAKDPKVYVVEDHIARLQPIKIGTVTTTRIEVIEGLDKNDLVVINGQINLSDSTAVSF